MTTAKNHGDSPHPPSRENPVYIYIYNILCILYIICIIYTYYTDAYIKELCQEVFIYNEEAPCTSHTSCPKVAILLLQNLSTLCVIYMVYIVTCLFSVRNTMKYLSKEYLSLNILKIRRTSLRLVFLMKVVYNEFLLLKNYRLWH